MSHVLPSPGPRKRFSERLEDVAIVMSLKERDIEHPGPHLGAETLRGVAWLLRNWLLKFTL